MPPLRRNADLALALAILAVHAAAVWGYTGPFWGDHGRWLHEVERFAQGEVPYRDFLWHFPPLALWVVGGGARLLGTDLSQITFITSSIAVMLVAAVVTYVREVTNRHDMLVLAASIVLAVSYVQVVGAPLPAGAYVPAASVGALCLTLASVFFWKEWNAGESRSGAWWLGFFAGLAVLSKQDFWLPSAFLVVVSALRFRRAVPVLMSAVTVAAGTMIVATTAGFSIITDIVGGFNLVLVTGGRGLPSWERLTVEVFSAAVVVGFLATMLSFARQKVYVRLVVGSAITAAAAGAIHVAVSMSLTTADLGSSPTPMLEVIGYHVRLGNALLRPALGWLRERAVSDPIPLVLYPALLLAVAARWATLDRRRRATVAVMLGFAILLRARRAFEGTEWFEFLLTVPVILLTVELLSGLGENELRRFRSATGVTLLAMAFLAYHHLGRGPGTERYFPAAAVARGTVHWPPGTVNSYRRLRTVIDSVDPTGVRPLFGFGYSGGWNYFLQRRNPFPFTQGLMFSPFDADSVLASPRPPGLLLIDNSVADSVRVPAVAIRLDRWEQSMVLLPYATYDRPRFDRLRIGCQAIAIDQTVFGVYVCP